MRPKVIFIIALSALAGCGSLNIKTSAPTAHDANSPATRFKQECLSEGHDEQSKAFFDCMEQHWAEWKMPGNAGTVANLENSAEKDGKLWLVAIERCKRLFESKKLKTHYERGLCVDKASEKYLAPYSNNQSALNEFRTDTLLLAVKLDKKEISQDEANVLAKRGWNKLVEAENAKVAQMQGQQIAQAQQAYQSQMQQQQYYDSRSAALMQGFLGIVQNQAQQNQQRAYIPPAPPQYAPPIPRPVTTQCNADPISGSTTCTTR